MDESVQDNSSLQDAVKKASSTNDEGDIFLQNNSQPFPTELIQVGRYMRENPKPIEYLIDHFFAKRAIGLLVGEGGIAKSLAALLLCIKLSCCDMISNLKWLDHFPLTTPRKTLYLHLEDEANDFHRRLRSILDKLFQEHNIPEFQQQEICEKISERFFMLPRETALTNTNMKFIDKNGAATELLGRLLKTCQVVNPDLIIVDTRTKASSVDENHNSDAGDEIETWTKLRDKTGASILIIAHTNKMSRNGSGGGNSIIRGASAYTDNSRFVVTFQYSNEKSEGSPKIDVRNPKNNQCKKADDFTVSLEYPLFKQVETSPKNADALSSKSSSNSQQIRDILDYVTENPGCTQRRMIDAFFSKIPKTHLNKLCQQLEIGKQLVREKRGTKKVGYYVTTTTSTEMSEADAFLNLVEGTTQPAQVSCPSSRPEAFPNFPEDSGTPSGVLSNPDSNEQLDLFTGAAPNELATTPDCTEDDLQTSSSTRKPDADELTGTLVVAVQSESEAGQKDRQPTSSAAASLNSNEPPIPPEPPLSLTPNKPEAFLGDSQQTSSTAVDTEPSEPAAVPDCTEAELALLSPMERVFRWESQDDPA